MMIGNVVSFLETALKLRRRILLVGAPGIGKTYAFTEASAHLGMDFIGLCSALEDPSTIRGYPSRGSNGEATHCLFDGIAKAFKATAPTCLCFDDLGMASESTMRSIVRLIQFGEIDNRRLPDCVVIGAASNDVGHSSGVYGMIEPLKTRFHSILQVETSVENVVQWGLANNWPAWLCAFLRNSPDSLHSWKACKSMKIDGACPRGWDYLAEWDNQAVSDVEVWEGCVGRAEAVKAHAFRGLVNELPDVDQCILDPEGTMVPENPSARYLVSMALASKMDHGNFGQALKYLRRLPKMFLAYSVRDAFQAERIRRQSGKLPANYHILASSRDFSAFAVSQEGKEILSAAQTTA